MSTEICKQETAKVLLVEGANDCHVVMALCEAHNIPENFGLYDCGNDDGVLKRLNALILAAERPEVIGVMLDADNPSLESRWRQIRKKLAIHEYTLPDTPDPTGTILDGIDEKPKLGFWLMPDNVSSGMLEDFCATFAVPEGLQFAQECVDGARERGVSTFKDVHNAKAVIHTYLAWQDKPGNPLGLAITAHALQPETDLAHRFTDWLGRLYG